MRKLKKGTPLNPTTDFMIINSGGLYFNSMYNGEAVWTQDSQGARTYGSTKSAVEEIREFQLDGVEVGRFWDVEGEEYPVWRASVIDWK